MQVNDGVEVVLTTAKFTPRSNTVFLIEEVPNSPIAATVRLYRKDFTDGAGHGFLIGTDSIFARLSSVATGIPNVANIRLLYRWKSVPLAEYIGIVQSQQS